MMVVLAIALTGIFAIASFSLNSALSFLKRQELQTLAESVAMAAALNLPNRALAKESAESWYDILRMDGKREIGEDRHTTKGALEISFSDNKKGASDTNPYFVNSITVTIHSRYRPRFAVSRIWKDTITITGSAEASLRPTDVMLVVENSASLLDSTSQNSATLETLFGKILGARYSNQCFGNAFAEFKTGMLKLYDNLSESASFRVGLMTSTSRTGEPLLLADLGQTLIPRSNLEYDGDQPDSHSTRCMAATIDKQFAVPQSSNIYQRTWRSRTVLRALFPSEMERNLGIDPEQRILTREALWTLPAGYATETGYIHPQYFYTSPAKAIELSKQQLKDSRRTDGRPVAHRMIIVATDDAGVFPEEWDNRSPTLVDVCKNWDKNAEGIKLGIVYFGHNQSLIGHDYDKSRKAGEWVEELRKNCSGKNIFLIEASPENNDKFKNFKSAMALLSYSLREAELLR